LTQIQLGNLTKSKVSGSNIGQIESGHTNPILSTLEDLAEALEIHITDLFPPKNI
jgi:transcriptional regulator with XRE-family HTH domain